jgi:hypothetical protein
MAGVRELALRLALAGTDRGDGTLVVSTNADGDRTLDDCRNLNGDLYPSHVGVVDCVSKQYDDMDARVRSAPSAGDLTGVGIEYSALYQALHGDGVERVRTALDSLSTFLAYSDLRTVSRFVHTFGGRVTTAGGLGLFVIDPASHDDRTVSTISQFCDGRIDVRETDTGHDSGCAASPTSPATAPRWTSSGHSRITDSTA